MRRLEHLIEDSRRETENDEFTDDTGIPDVEFIRWSNDAQHRIQAKIAQQNDRVFMKETIFNTVSQQEAYDLPADMLFQNRISNIEISLTGTVKDYFTLDQATLKERNTIVFGDPLRYIRVGGKILLNPVPNTSQNKIRMYYVNRLPRLDTRRATVLSVTTNASNNITALTFDVAQNLDSAALNKNTQFSIVDADGVQKMRRIPFTNIDTSTGVVTVDPTFVFESTESIAAGDYVVAAPDGSNSSELPDSLERYIVNFMNWKALKRDSSGDSAEAQAEILALEAEIVESFSDVDDDIHRIPLINNAFIVDEDFI